MSVVYNATVYECDGPDCSRQVVQPGLGHRYNVGIAPSLPEGWLAVLGHADIAAPWVYCSVPCLYRAAVRQVPANGWGAS